MTTPCKNSLKPVTSYPLFKANQLLTAENLNDLGEYLDQQTRMARLCLVGAGTLCGFIPRLEGDTLVISKGCGVTSEGYLIHLDEDCRVGHYSEESLARSIFLGEVGGSNNDIIEALELFEAEQDKSTPLNAEVAKAMVVALLLECTDEKGEVCADDCDETGTQRIFKVRKFLIKPQDGLDLIGENYDAASFRDWSLEDLLVGRYGMADLYLERFGYTAADDELETDLTTITSYEIFLKHYSAIIEDAAKRIAPALKRTLFMFSPLFSRFKPIVLPDLPLERFKSTGERPLEIQYLYDHLFDLILAYDEFREVAFDLMDVCRADAGWFPMHLFLGKPLSGATELPIPPAIDRTPYVQPPVYNGNRSRADAARLLFKRLELLIKNFSTPIVSFEDDALRIMPSRYGSAPLSARAIPYYYSDPEELRRVWNGDRHRKNRDRQTFGYYFHRPQNGPDSYEPNPPYDDPLVFDFEAYGFLRIEGHVGQELSFALSRVQELRRKYNLPFDIVVLKLGEEIDDNAVDYDCDFEVLEAQYTKLRTDLRCAIEQWHFMTGKQTEGIRELLDKLSDKLDDFNYDDDFVAAFDKVVEVVHAKGEAKQCLLGYDKQAFKDLHDVQRRRKEAVERQTLFHKFAESHPGIEHKAGVPRGGTFILVYHERELGDKEREKMVKPLLDHLKPQYRINENVHSILKEGLGRTSQTVVADFCLPYLCCSNSPPIAYCIARPRPTLIIYPASFCAEDTDEYEFVVYPTGGELTGRGTKNKEERYFFVPKDTGLAEGSVEVTYSVDGTEAKLVLTILPVPQATFKVQEKICSREGLVPLYLNHGTELGGRFTTDIDSSDDQRGITVTNEGVFFDPAAAGILRGKIIQITYTVQDKNGCSASYTQNTRVYDTPNAGFTGLRETYCSTDEASELEPEDPDVKSQFAGTGNSVKGNWFYPGNVLFDKEEVEVQVAVSHHVIDNETGCEAGLTEHTSVFLVPKEGSFAIEPQPPGETTFRFAISDIQPKQSEDGPFWYVFDWKNGSHEHPNSKDFTLEIPQHDLESQDLLMLKLVLQNNRCLGPAFEKISKILRKQEEPTGEKPIPDHLLELLRRRHVRNLSLVNQLAVQHEGLEVTRSFQLTGALIKAAPDRLIMDLVVDYVELINTLVPVYKRAGGERKKAYQKLVETASLTLLDRIVTEPGSEATRSSLSEQFDRISDAGFDLEALQDAWLTPELESELSAEQIEVVRSLIG
jgi:hypothetical protein